MISIFTIYIYCLTDIKEKSNSCDAENDLQNLLPDTSQNNLLNGRPTDASSSPSLIVIESTKNVTYKDDDSSLQDAVEKADTAHNISCSPITTIKPYQCDVCGKTFIKTSQLVVHKRTHTGKERNNLDLIIK